MTRLLVFCGVLLLATPLSAQTLRIFQIDVESADAALIVMPKGKTLLIDSGKNNMGPRIKAVMDAASVVRGVQGVLRRHTHKPTEAKMAAGDLVMNVDL